MNPAAPATAPRLRRRHALAPTVAARIAAVMRSHSDRVFGVMGNGNSLLIDAFLHSDGAYSALRHEAGAVAAADAYARTTGRVGVCTTTFGAGFGNTVTALADAVRGRSSLVLVTGDAPTTGHRPADLDIPSIVRGVGAASFTVIRGREADVARAAFAYAEGYGVPVVLSVPYDLSGEEASGGVPSPHGPASAASRQSARSAPPPALADGVVDAVLGAERLLVIAGRGAVVSGAEQGLRSLATLRSAMTATTALAHGIFGSHPRHLGIAGGFGAPAAAEIMAEADVVLVVGAGLNAHTTRHSGLFPGARVIRADHRELPIPPGRAASWTQVTMDARDLVDGLLRRAGDAPPTRSWSAYPAHTEMARRMPRQPSADRRLHPQDLSQALAAALPTDRALVVDGGNFMAWPLEAIAVSTGRAFVPAGLAVQSVGLGLPALIGAATAHPERLTVLAAGDGGLLMSLADLESAARLVERGLIVVYNDAAYGAELHQYGPQGLDTSAMRFPETDFAALARAVGIPAAVVHSVADLALLDDWLSSRRPGLLLLDCRIADDVHAPFLLPVAVQ